MTTPVWIWINCYRYWSFDITLSLLGKCTIWRSHLRHCITQQEAQLSLRDRATRACQLKSG